MNWAELQNIAITIAVGIGSIAYIGEKIMSSRARSRSEALQVALAEVESYKGRTETLEVENAKKDERISTLQTQMAELQGKVDTYERLISGKDVSPAMSTLINTNTEAILKTIADMDEAWVKSFNDTRTLLEDIKALMVDQLQEMKKHA